MNCARLISECKTGSVFRYVEGVNRLNIITSEISHINFKSGKKFYCKKLYPPWQNICHGGYNFLKAKTNQANNINKNRNNNPYFILSATRN